MKLKVKLVRESDLILMNVTKGGWRFLLVQLTGAWCDLFVFMAPIWYSKRVTQLECYMKMALCQKKETRDEKTNLG